MYETTDRCPFYKICETHLDLMRIQNVLIKERRESLTETSYLERVEYNTIMSDYQRKIISIDRIEERCSSNYKRCLRFWQTVRRENRDKMSAQLAHDMITQVTTRWRAHIHSPWSNPWVLWLSRARAFSCCLLGYSLYLNIRRIADILIHELEKTFLRNSSTLQVEWSSCNHQIKEHTRQGSFPHKRVRPKHA